MIQYFLQEAVKGQFFTVKRTRLVSQMSIVQYVYYVRHPEFNSPDQNLTQRE